MDDNQREVDFIRVIEVIGRILFFVPFVLIVFTFLGDVILNPEVSFDISGAGTISLCGLVTLVYAGILRYRLVRKEDKTS